MKENKRRNIIPIGIFFIIFLFLLMLSAAISAFYFYFEAKNRITEIENYTRSYSIPLAEAFANMAELSYKAGNTEKIKKLFREKIQASIIHEAFFVFSDGKIIAHSDKGIEKELKGNIATDEFAYNIDLIMMPIWTKINHAQFMDYHIYNEGKKIYFDKRVVKLLKRFVYSKIDISGWLVTKAVYVNGKGVGCISFIISKDGIYRFLAEHFNNTLRLSVVLAAISLAISFLVSIIVFVRYRSLNRDRHYERAGDNIDDIDKEEILDEKDLNKKKLKEAIKLKHDSTDMAADILTEKKIIKDAIASEDKQG